ncbi:MAG: tetraacyldisaccharide 4'-kinase [Gammaproteobacteria bacterium]|nr:MAG: tetraacyldisaccharide 4'-kinase [Gammaproteobacteria bacterium]
MAPAGVKRGEQFIEELWYGRHPLSLLLAPLGWLFALAVRLRRLAWRSGLLSPRRLPVPVIVVGNISVGGTGKTPLVIWLCKRLREAGHRPGVVIRGYRGLGRHWPQQARPDSDPRVVGDEAVVLARRTGCPIAVGPDRVAAGEALLEYHDCDLIVSDDGLQHYRLARDVEIAVVDGIRRHGNRRCLPAGPLREPVSRLREVDLVVSNGVAGRGEFPMKYVPGDLVSLIEPQARRPLERFRGQPVHAVAAIGMPERFFSLLVHHGLRVEKHPFPDHHVFTPQELDFGDDLPVLMTEKDAVKCLPFARPDWWYLPIEADLPETFLHRLKLLLKEK